MAGIMNQFLKGMGVGDGLRDYKHASKTFVDSFYRLSPKYAGLFHVFIDLNAVTQVDQSEQIEIGLMAKSVTLPKFTIQNKVHNAYNRKFITQSKINYDPISITFHDDSADVVRKFWSDYYSYYYRDSDYEEPLYTMSSKYTKREKYDWGYTPRTNNIGGTQSYINAIRIYSMHQGTFSSYTLLNPMITAFQHGEHTQGTNEFLEHSMTVGYEAIRYETGQVAAETVRGFNVAHYDNTPSSLNPLGGGTRSFIGPGGLVNSASDIITKLGEGNIGDAALIALKTYNNFKNADLKEVAISEAIQVGKDILKGQNPNSTVFFPSPNKIANAIKGTNSKTGTNE